MILASRHFAVLLVLCALLQSAGRSHAESGFLLPSSVLSSTGGLAAAGNTQLGFTLGQAASGLSSATGLQETVGFWHPAVPMPVAVPEPPPIARPAFFDLLPIVPNPARVTTVIRYVIPQEAVREAVTITLLDVIGRTVRVWTASAGTPGIHSVTWDGRTTAGVPAPAGVYLYRMDAGSIHLTRRLALVR